VRVDVLQAAVEFIVQAVHERVDRAEDDNGFALLGQKLVGGLVLIFLEVVADDDSRGFVDDRKELVKVFRGSEEHKTDRR
jgi:hypothetical protein